MLEETERMRELSHEDLKEVAKLYLLNEMNFSKSDIQEEWKLVFGKKSYIIDVVGLDKNKNVLVAIECGDVQYEKMCALKELVSNIVHIPYYYEFFTYTNTNFELQKAKEENGRLSWEIEEQQKIIDDLEKKLGVFYHSKKQKERRLKALDSTLDYESLKN